MYTLFFAQTIAKYEAMIRVLEEERDNYKRELDAAKAVRRPASPVRLTPTKVCMPSRLYQWLTK